jgi:hypothetical protein
MKKKPDIKGNDLPKEAEINLNDETNEFIQRKKIQNKVLKELIGKLQSNPANEQKEEK